MASKEEKPKIVKKAVVKKKVVRKVVAKPNYKSLSIKAIYFIASEGISLTKACERVKMNRRDFFEQIKLHEDVSNDYARACEIRCEMWAEEILDIADSEHFIHETKSGKDDLKGIWNETNKKDNAAKRKDMIDARKWLLSKMMPKKYGTVKEDKEDINIVVQPILSNNPLLNDKNDNLTT